MKRIQGNLSRVLSGRESLSPSRVHLFLMAKVMGSDKGWGDGGKERPRTKGVVLRGGSVRQALEPQVACWWQAGCSTIGESLEKSRQVSPSLQFCPSQVKELGDLLLLELLQNLFEFWDSTWIIITIIIFCF